MRLKSNGGKSQRWVELEGMGAFLLALGCARAWLTLLFAAPALPEQADLDAHRVFDIALTVICVAVALNARRIAPLSSTRWIRPLIGISMVGSSLLSIASALMPSAAMPFAFAGALMGGLGFGSFLLLWAEALAPLSIVKIALFSSGSQVFAVILVFFCQGMAHTQLIAATIVLPFIALAAVSHATQRWHRAADSPEGPYANSKGNKNAFSIPWKLIALMGVYSFAYGLREEQLAAGAGMYSSVSTALGMTAFFLLVYFLSDRMSIGALYKSTPLLVLCGFLLIPGEEFLGNIASSYLISIGYTLMSLLVALLLYDISKRFGIAIIALAGMKNAMQFFVGLGNDCTRLIQASSLPLPIQEAAPTVAVVVLIFIATFILFSEKELTAKWGIRFLEHAPFAEESREQKKRVDRCDELSRRGKLSPREDEILRLYAQGKNGPAIEKELFIAEGTLKTHTRHIYEKLGISSRKELLKALEIGEGD